METTVRNVGQGAFARTKTLLHLDNLGQYLTWANLVHLITSVLAVIFFYILYRIIKKIVRKESERRFKPHTVEILSKAVSYSFYIIISMYILNLFGIEFGAVWGAAGIVGVAIGFAAQTSVSNLISGLFVISEKSMKIGDFISVGGVSGTVDSVGFLAVKIRTADNQMVRVPNSTVINSNLENTTFFEKRRFVFEVMIAYESDLKNVLEIMKTVPTRCPTVLTDPVPVLYYDGLGSSGVSLKIAVWFKTADLIQTKNDVYSAIVQVCHENAVTIPYARYDVKLLNTV
jgi:small-conductance mechanosensitive channel